jgi:hypothetical protein
MIGLFSVFTSTFPTQSKNRFEQNKKNFSELFYDAQLFMTPRNNITRGFVPRVRSYYTYIFIFCKTLLFLSNLKFYASLYGEARAVVALESGTQSWVALASAITGAKLKNCPR